MSSKDYRSLLAVPGTKSPLSSVEWKFFWKLPLSHYNRIVCYRILSNRVPCRAILHNLIPSFFTSALCSLCGTDDDTLEHFLWLCPLKLTVWSSIWSTHFETAFTLNALSCSILSLEFSTPLKLSLNSKPSEIICSTMSSIWRAHWSFVFSDIPFVPQTVIATASRQILTSHHESLIKSGTSHVPIFTLDC
ncbi:hypothetical protein A0J61_10378 [Choanephora cucurbitarum]|uniref:Reverse transcriptase zinc-binding domain-containing protein n=1 Tax=Choanephora cucurbitarum TaxID=101091 RepID=A0A1C7MXL4_9FUNG|nr:hypothetical protein A0J61_10378 [Choanephora cucurbitarum]